MSGHVRQFSARSRAMRGANQWARILQKLAPIEALEEAEPFDRSTGPSKPGLHPEAAETTLSSISTEGTFR